MDSRLPHAQGGDKLGFSLSTSGHKRRSGEKNRRWRKQAGGQMGEFCRWQAEDGAGLSPEDGELPGEVSEAGLPKTEKAGTDHVPNNRKLLHGASAPSPGGSADMVHATLIS